MMRGPSWRSPIQAPLYGAPLALKLKYRCIQCVSGTCYLPLPLGSGILE